MKKINFLLVLFSLYILSSCQNPVSPPNPQSPSIPAGKGAFTLVISDVNGRTIYPNTTINSFAEYKIEFYPEGGGAPIEEIRTNATLSTDPIILDIGKYNLQVTAYMSAGGGKPAAYGKSPSLIEIKENQTNTGSVSLKAITTGTGTFRWNISFPTEITEASMTITPLGSNGTPVQTLYFTGGTPDIQKQDFRVLNSGYYNVLITLFKDDKTQRIERRDILHIYQYLESIFTFTFYSSDFYKKNYIVTFVYNNEYGNGIQTYDLEAKIDEPDPTKPGYIFDGWYKDEHFTDKWNIEEDTVTGDMLLYAKWMTGGEFTLVFTITDQLQIVDSNITIYTGMGLEKTATITVSNASEFDRINWYYEDKTLDPEGHGILTLTSLILGSVSGYRFITVEAIKTDGTMYSALVMVKVQMPTAKIGTTLYATLDDAIKAVPDTGTTIDPPTEIILLTNVTAPETGMTITNNACYTIKTGQHIVLTVDTDCNLKINASAGNFALFTVNSTASTNASSASLVLNAGSGSLTLSGGGLTNSYTNRRGIYIYNGGTVVINGNVTIAGFKCYTGSSSYSGGGVYVTGANASFTMNGGKIYGNSSDVTESERNEAYTNTAAIYVDITGTARYGGRYGPTRNISSTSDTLPALAAPTISPSGSVSTYTKLYAVYNGNETVSYQWRYSSSYSTPSLGTDLPGATSPWYIPTTSGYYSVTVSAAGYTGKTSSSSVSVGTGTLAGNIIITPNGRIQPGDVLTASYDGTEPETNNVTINYQWYKESTSLSGENTSVYTPNNPGIYNLNLTATGYNAKPNIAGDIVAYILPGKVTSMGEDHWEDGTLGSADSQDWYCIDVSPGTEYHVWLNHVNFGYGDGVKTASSRVSIIYEDGELVCLDQYYYYTWSSYVTIKSASNSSSKVYIQVKPYSSSTGTYGIVYSTGTKRPKNDTLNPSVKTATLLTENTWKDGALDSAASQDWYWFNVTSGDTYYVWWNERTSYLSNTKGGDTLAEVDVTAWYSDGSEAFENSDTSWWPAPKKFEAKTSGRITLQIRPRGASSSYTGVYQIVYNKSSVKPVGNQGDWTAPSSYLTLTNGSWANGTLSTTGQQDWYSFTVTAGTTYRVWWYDYYDDYNSSYATVMAGGCYDNGEVCFYEQTSGSYAREFTAAYSGTVYIRAKYSSRTGNYRIVFSTGTTKP